MYFVTHSTCMHLYHLLDPLKFQLTMAFYMHSGVVAPSQLALVRLPTGLAMPPCGFVASQHGRPVISPATLQTSSIRDSFMDFLFIIST